MSYEVENGLSVFQEDTTLNTHTYYSGGFKKVENVGESLSTTSWEGMGYLQVRSQTSSKKFHTVESHMVSYIESTLRYDFPNDTSAVARPDASLF